MAVAGKEGIDSTVGSVGSSSSSHGLVDLNISDDEFIDVQFLVFSIGDRVFEERKHVSHGLLGPSALGQSPLLSLAGSAGAALVLGERDTPGVVENLIQILLGLLDKHSSDGFCGFVGVLEMHS